MSEQPKEVSIGSLFEELDRIRSLSLQAAKKTTEFYEKDIARTTHDLSNVVADIVFLLREHLSCHDCKVVDHSHTVSPEDGVIHVLSEVVEREE